MERQPTPPAAVPTPRGTPLTSARSTASPDTRTKSGNLHLVEREKPDLYDCLADHQGDGAVAIGWIGLAVMLLVAAFIGFTLAIGRSL